MINQDGEKMENIEIIKNCLSKYIFRTHSTEVNSRGFMCLHTLPAIEILTETFPLLNEKTLLKIISEEIYIKKGKYTTFVYGKSCAARKINLYLNIRNKL